jgi:hypothetical protein
MKLPEVPETNKQLAKFLPIESYIIPFEVMLADEERFPFLSGVDEINQARYGQDYQMNMKPGSINYTGLFVMFGIVGKGLFWGDRCTDAPNVTAYMRSLGMVEGQPYVIVNGYSPIPSLLNSTTLFQHASKQRAIRKAEKEAIKVEVVKKKKRV